MISYIYAVGLTRDGLVKAGIRGIHVCSDRHGTYEHPNPCIQTNRRLNTSIGSFTASEWVIAPCNLGKSETETCGETGRPCRVFFGGDGVWKRGLILYFHFGWGSRCSVSSSSTAQSQPARLNWCVTSVQEKCRSWNKCWENTKVKYIFNIFKSTQKWIWVSWSWHPWTWKPSWFWEHPSSLIPSSSSIPSF